MHPQRCLHYKDAAHAAIVHSLLYCPFHDKIHQHLLPILQTRLGFSDVTKRGYLVTNSSVKVSARSVPARHHPEEATWESTRRWCYVLSRQVRRDSLGRGRGGVEVGKIASAEARRPSPGLLPYCGIRAQISPSPTEPSVAVWLPQDAAISKWLLLLVHVHGQHKFWLPKTEGPILSGPGPAMSPYHVR